MCNNICNQKTNNNIHMNVAYICIGHYCNNYNIQTTITNNNKRINNTINTITMTTTNTANRQPPTANHQLPLTTSANHYGAITSQISSIYSMTLLIVPLKYSRCRRCYAVTLVLWSFVAESITIERTIPCLKMFKNVFDANLFLFFVVVSSWRS